MGIRWEAVKALITGKADSGMMDFMQSGRSKPPDRNTEEWLQSYLNNPRLAPVRKIATDLSSIQGKLYRGAGEKRKEVQQHPFLDFWDCPNPLPELTAANIWRLLEIWYQLKGMALCVIERDHRGMPTELWPVPPHWIMDIPHRGHTYYTIKNPDGKPANVPLTDAFVLKDLNPLNPYTSGAGQAEAVADEVEAYEYATKYSKMLFFNDARPDYLIAAPGVTEEQIKRFIASLEARHRGPWNAHRPGIIPREVNMFRMSDSPREMDFIASRKDLRDTINSHWGVPPEMLGIVENSNRATAAAAKSIYAENVLTPQLMLRQNAINVQLLPQFERGLEWEYDDIIPQDVEYQLRVANEGLSRGAIMVNEWRTKMGLDSVEGGDVFLMPIGCMVVQKGDFLSTDMRGDGANINPTDPAGANITPAGVKARRVPPDRNRVPHAMDKTRREQERSAGPIIYRALKKQLYGIIKQLGADSKAEDDGWTKLLTVDMSGDMRNVADRVESILLQTVDWPYSESELLSNVRTVWQTAYGSGAELASNVYNISIRQPSLTHQLLVSGAQRIKGITDTTREMLSKTIAEGIVAGDGRQQLIDRVRTVMPGASPGRAGVIAANEVHTSLMSGNFNTIRDAGFTTKTWLTAGDSDVRESHRQLNGVTIGINERFANGLLYPGDPNGRPSDIIGCRCDLIAGEEIQAIPIQERSEHDILRSGGEDHIDNLPPEVERLPDIKQPLPDEAAELLAMYEREIAENDFETAIVMTRSGKSYRIRGRRSSVDISALSEEELYKAVMTHNHPAGVTKYSFSAEDISNALGHRFAVLRGVDDEYEYEIRTLPNTIVKDADTVRYEFKNKYMREALNEAWSRRLNMDTDGYHYACQRMSEDYGFYYVRRKRK